LILSDVDILRAIERGEIKIIPFKRENLGPCSVDLTLGSKFRTFGRGLETVDPNAVVSTADNTVLIDTRGEPFIIRPGEFVLGITRERIAVSKGYAATLEGKSSIARLGLVVHAAGLVNPGTGMREPSQLVLEIFCQNSIPVKLYPGMKIVQIIFHKLTTPASVGYDEREGSKFVGQKEPVL